VERELEQDFWLQTKVFASKILFEKFEPKGRDGEWREFQNRNRNIKNCDFVLKQQDRCQLPRLWQVLDGDISGLK